VGPMVLNSAADVTSWREIMLLALLLQSPAVQVMSETDYYRCQGLATAAAGFVAGAGLQIAAAARSCGIEADTCANDISIAVASLARAAVLGTGAGEACGGPTNPCATSITQASAFFTEAAAAGSSAAVEVRGRDFDEARREVKLMGESLRDAGRAVTGAEAFCKPPVNNTAQTPNYIGFCVSDSLQAATALAAAGIAIKGAVAECPSRPAECARHVAFTMGMLSKVAEDSALTAASCKATGNPQCVFLASAAAYNLAAAAGEGAGVEADLQDGDQDDAINSMVRFSENMQQSAQRIGQAVHQCEHPNDPINPQETNVGQCIGDVVSGASFVASAGLEISFAANDCKANNTGEQAGQAVCAQDVTFMVALFAHASNQIMFATEDCRYGSTFNAICGSSIALSIEAIGEAAYSASKAAEFAVTPADIDGQAPNFDEVRESIQELSISMQQFGQTLSRSVRSCVRQVFGMKQGKTSLKTLRQQAQRFTGPWEAQRLREPRTERLAPFLRSWTLQIVALGQPAVHPWKFVAFAVVSALFIAGLLRSAIRIINSTKALIRDGDVATDQSSSIRTTDMYDPVDAHDKGINNIHNTPVTIMPLH